MYSEYCSNQVAAAKLLDKLKEENYNFFNFIDVIFISFFFFCDFPTQTELVLHLTVLPI